MPKKYSSDSNGVFSGAQYVYLLAGMVFFVAFCLLAWFVFQYKKIVPLVVGVPSEFSAVTSTLDSVIDYSPSVCVERRLLDGLCNVGDINPPLVGVMIENSADAWPLAGLSSASVVYEAPVEANIPRFLALYPVGDGVEKVGPVRSARPYYLDWAAEYGSPIYLHVGGSPEALERLGNQTGLTDINEFFRGWYFWRATDRSAPHNTYTSGKLWRAAWRDYAVSARPEWQGWTFEDRKSCTTECIKKIDLSFGSSGYNFVWEYSSSTQTYQRLWHGEWQFHEDGGILADNVIVQYVTSTVIDDLGRKQIGTVGKGKATIFRNGYKLDGEWRKSSRTARTLWYDADGNQIPLKPGKIWIEVLSANANVITK